MVVSWRHERYAANRELKAEAWLAQPITKQLMTTKYPLSSCADPHPPPAGSL
jgi:hypothetical protein